MKSGKGNRRMEAPDRVNILTISVPDEGAFAILSGRSDSSQSSRIDMGVVANEPHRASYLILPALALAATISLGSSQLIQKGHQEDEAARVMPWVMNEPSQIEIVQETRPLREGEESQKRGIFFEADFADQTMSTKQIYSALTHVLFHVAWLSFMVSVLCLGLGSLLGFTLITSLSPFLLVIASASLWFCLHRANNERAH